MAELRAVVVGDIERVCVFLEESMHRGMNKDEYRSLFTYPWMVEKAGIGYLLEDNDRVVGFLGAIYSDRIIRGKTERFCNLTNWSVLPEFRNESLRLLFALLGKPGQTVLNLSPSKEVEKMLIAMRYRVLDTFKLFSVPLSHFWTFFWRGGILWARSEIQALLDEGQRKIMEDHARTGCQFLAVVDEQHYCFIVAKRRKKQGISFTEILHVSNPELLRRSFERVKLSLLLKDRTVLLAIDERLLGTRLALMLPYRRVSFFQSRSVVAQDIDNLYSEIALL